MHLNKKICGLTKQIIEEKLFIYKRKIQEGGMGKKILFFKLYILVQVILANVNYCNVSLLGTLARYV